MSLNTPAYQRFKERWNVWCQCLAGDDPHSIIQQVYHMVWDAAAFRIVNEARGFAPCNAKGEMELNGLVHRLLNHGFFTTQLLAIRKLMDKGEMDGARGVFSLRRLLLDMRDHTDLITREHMFAVRDLAYDYAPLIRKEEEYMRQQFESGEDCVVLPPELDCHRNKWLHRVFDRLGEVEPKHRQPSDTPAPAVFTHLLRKLEAAGEDVARHVDKFIAHAATPQSRAQAQPSLVQPTLGHLWKAHKAICEIVNVLDSCLLTGSSHHFLAAPQYDQFKYIDRPLVARDQVERLQRCWAKYDEETSAWGAFGMTELMKEIRPQDDSQCE